MPSNEVAIINNQLKTTPALTKRLFHRTLNTPAAYQLLTINYPCPNEKTFSSNPKYSRSLSTVNYQLSIINYQLSIINYPCSNEKTFSSHPKYSRSLSDVNYQLSTINYPSPNEKTFSSNPKYFPSLSTVNYQLSTINCQLLTSASFYSQDIATATCFII